MWQPTGTTGGFKLTNLCEFEGFPHPFVLQMTMMMHLSRKREGRKSDGFSFPTHPTPRYADLPSMSALTSFFATGTSPTASTSSMPNWIAW